jgi:hypothetical protein
MERPVLYLHDLDDGITDPAEARFLASVLPAAAEALETAQAEWGTAHK